MRNLSGSITNALLILTDAANQLPAGAPEAQNLLDAIKILEGISGRLYMGPSDTEVLVSELSTSGLDATPDTTRMTH